MATRESRRLKEKRSVVPFGDIMLPVIGLVAVGLLIVGVKMFFLSGDKNSPYNPPVARTSPAAPQKMPEKPSTALPIQSSPTVDPKKIEKNGGEVTLAIPAGSSREEVPAAKKESPIASPPKSKTKIETKKPMPPKTTAPSKKPGVPSLEASRWGVQIGALSSKESAESLRQQASKSGYTSTVTKAVVGGKTLYRVTVPAGKDRDSAVSLSGKLQKAGFPVFVVEVR